ncbi:MAG: hypothetical protein H7Z10_06555 [Gemmatimonadaceae bacterium]|nr:hypothetical protein [Acetobacteraceae bacterium]
MAATANRTDPALWERTKHEVTEGDKGGEPGQWSARKAQLAVQRYKAAGGGYKGRKAPDNHLAQWTQEDWGTKSGEPSAETGERYLPKKTRAALTDKEYARTSAKKRADTARGKQHSAQPDDVARKTASARLADLPRTELLKRAAQHNLPGRSRMRKADLVAALGRA